jgi:hypothetical protein
MAACAASPQIFQDGNHTAGQFQVSSATWASMVIKDFTSVMGLLPQYALPGAKWYMSQQGFFSIAAKVFAEAGGNRTDTLSEEVKHRILGFPVVFAQKLPIVTPGSGKPMFFFGDLSKAAALGERRGVTIKRSDHRYFENDQIGLLGTERFDINCHDLGDTSVAGPHRGGQVAVVATPDPRSGPRAPSAGLLPRFLIFKRKGAQPMTPQLKTIVAVNAVSKTNGATASGIIDTLGYDWATIDIIATTADVVSNKPTVCKLQEADDTNATSFADITAFATPTIPNANTAATAVLQNNYKFNVDCRARKRYLQAGLFAADHADRHRPRQSRPRRAGAGHGRQGQRDDARRRLIGLADPVPGTCGGRRAISAEEVWGGMSSSSGSEVPSDRGHRDRG